MSGREPAWRLCAAELLEATVEEPPATERSAGYLLTPAGARVNRGLLAGTLSVPVGRSTPDTSPFWTARLSDPTGAIDVTAGRFQPRALVEMQAIRDEGPAVVVGKSNRYTTRDGRTMVALRAESVRSCTPHEAAGFHAEAAEHLASRLSLRERILARTSQPDTDLAEGVPVRWVAAQRESIRRYPALDLARYRELVALLRRPGSGSTSKAPERSTLLPPVRILRREEPPRRAASEGHPVDEAILVEEVDRLAEGSEDGYANFEAIAQSATARGLPRKRIEESVVRLVANGILEEPLLGKLRRTA